MEFEDERINYALPDLALIASGGKKLMAGKFDKLTTNEMLKMYDELYLAFHNYYGEEVPAIGHLTTIGMREVFEAYKEVIRDKLEYFIKRSFNY